jgi:hypothetical protein
MVAPLGFVYRCWRTATPAGVLFYLQAMLFGALFLPSFAVLRQWWWHSAFVTSNCCWLLGLLLVFYSPGRIV